MTQPARIPQYRRFLAGVLAGLLGFGPLATPSYAALTLLADQPLNAQNQAKPNIVLTVDDSTSMLFDFLPDSVVTEKYCRGMNGSMNTNCGTTGSNTDLTFFNRGKYVSPGYIYQQYGTPYGPYNGYDLSGPGSGCDLTTVLGSTCSGGISPGVLPGIERYPNPAGPPPAKSPKAGQPYEYWTLWPAPAHNSELNHVYYNPRAQYDPPLRADGSSYPQMDSGATTGWTLVPADPWAATVKYVDLTLPLTIGQWCNSDWSIGNENNPAYCRTNGTGASAATSSTSSADGDYMYPWVPPGIDPAGSPTIAKSIAYSKVDTLGAIKPAWATAKDPKYFYENDNILWCDPTSSLWPQGGALIGQTCVGATSQGQTCVGALPQTCGGGNAQTCNNVTPQTCNGQQPQTCGNYQGQTCLNAVGQVCNGLTPQTCANIGVQTCDNPTPQTCNGVTPQTCNNITGQICNNVRTQVCNLGAPVCTPPNPSTCTTNWNPPGCNLCTDECGTCTLDTTCPPGTCANSSTNGAACQIASDCPPTGRCSVSNAVCTSDPQCPTVAGSCSRVPSACFLDTDCPLEGNCSTSGALCQSNANCPTLAGNCSTSNAVCFNDPQCVNVGRCSLTNAICPPNLCPTQAGQCTITSLPCFNNLQCPDANGTCSVSNALCTSNAQCPTIAGGCSLNGQACTINAQCGLSGTCSINPTVCANNAQCPTIPGACSTSGLVCTVNANCPTLAGTCSGSGLACMANANCPNLGQTCSISGLGCNPGVCPVIPGTCSLSGLACTANANCPNIVTAGACSITLAVCTTNAQCPGVGSPSGDAVCSDMRSDNLMSLLQDANGPGLVCRHNNRVGGYTSGPYDYPDARYNHPVTAGVGANACVASPRYASVPRHYWKTGVEWCDFAVGGAVLATPKWLGYGDRSQGTCQDAQDTTHIYPRFYQFGQPPATDNDLIPAFRRTDLIVGATYTHDWTDSINGAQSITRTYVEEMTNYANWFAYYRTRIQAVKTVTSASFSEIDAKYRVGFHAMYSLPSFLNVADFDAVQKPAWFSKLFGVTIPLGQETPTLTAVTRVGDYFKDGTQVQLVGSTDPITLSCQQNFHMLFTDGFTNQSGLPVTRVGNVDDVVPNATPLAGFPVGLAANPVVGLTQGQPWPRPYREDTAGSASNALSDYAMAYWVTDLRPGMIDNVPTDNTPPLAGDRYSAKWQHLNFAALSMGTSGKLAAGNQVATELALRDPFGTLQWPQPIPFVYKPDASAVDDLWHGAMNGHGDFVNADSIDEVKLGIGKILAGVTNLPGTRTSVGFVSNTFGASANFIYRVRFEQGWSGSLTKIQIDPTTGLPLAQPPIWDASAQLTAVTTPPAGWLTGRRIVTMNEAGTRVPFLWASLGANQKDSLAPGRPIKGQAISEFLRGNRAREGGNVGQLRVRASPMGDIVDSSPVYIGAPNAPYLDANDPGYSGFKTGAAATRAPQLYVGGNDGMLHVFEEATGNETWAYVPTPLFRGGTATALPPVPNDPRTGLGALAYQDGALPAFRHHFYVDSTPKIVDVDFNAPAGNQWRTLLVGGLGKGGNRYYALDVTIPPAAATLEAAVANQVLWEFPPVGNTAIDMGYTYGKPMIAKTRGLFPTVAGSGKGAWLAIVGSGYNNPSGVGKLYFLQASDPANYKVMSTGVGNPGSPAGLAHPAGYTQDFHNQLAEQIYSGDLLGNLWRFDVSDPISDSNWPAAGQYAKLIPPSGVGVQPVTTPPEIKIDLNNGIDRWVFVGTGKLYDDTDLADTQLQTMYAFRDGTASTPWTLPATPVDRTTAGMVPLPSLNPTNNFGLATAPPKGWYDDLPAGSRIVVAPQAAFGVLAYIATKPLSADLCATGLPVTLYAREYGTGQSVLTQNPDGTGPIVFGLDIAQGGVGLQIVTFEPAPGASTPDVRLAITLPDGTVRYVKPKLPSAFFQHRMSWRLLGQ